MKKGIYILSVIIVLLVTIASYVLWSFFHERTGVIVIGKEAIVFTEREFDEIQEYDYDVNGKDWVWIGNDEKLKSLCDDKKICEIINNRGCIKVKIRYMNLFVQSEASYVQESGMPIVHVFSIVSLGGCK